VEDILKRLLEVEIKAEKLVADAQVQREAMVHQTLLDTQQAEQQLKSQIPELRANLLQKAEARASQSIAELQKRYAEKKIQLQQSAKENHDKALDAALQLFMNIGRNS
jgi:V/A-type H+/Na+-transporting ATPase subunit G/H